MLAPQVKTLLGTLRRRIRQYIWLEGCAAAVACLGVAFWATLAADWFFEPTAEVRGIMLAGVGVALAAVLLHFIGRRAFVPISDSNAATLLERRFPRLNDSLLTAVVLGSREVDDADVNREMLARTFGEAEDRIADLNVAEVFNARPLWLHGVAAMLLTLSIAFFAILFPEAFGVWARRALGLSNELWPRTTRLEIAGFPGGVKKVARGSDLDVVAKADALAFRVPASVEVRYRVDGGGRGRATMDRRGVAGPGDAFQEYAYTFRGILSDVHFDVLGGDARVPDLWIQAVDSPTISRMTLDCELPAYIGRKLPPQRVTGVMQVPMGSRVTVHAAKANKELVRVDVAGIVDDRPMPAKSLEIAKLADDHRGFSLALGRLVNDTTLLFTLTDADEIQSREPVRLAIAAAPDQPPQVAVRLDGIGTAITARARLPVVGRLTDDYGIGRAWFECAIDQQKPSERPIAQWSKGTPVYTLDKAALDVAEFGLKPGRKFYLSVKASDVCDLGHGPNVTGGERWMLDVVTPEQLRAILEARELVLRQRFEQMIQEMTETRDLVSRLKFDGDKDARLLRVDGATTNCRKSAQEVLGLAESFDDIRKQLVNNRIDTEELKNRLQDGIAGPLHDIVAAMFPELERRLDELRKQLDDKTAGPAARGVAQRQADEILLAMRKVLDRMIEMEDFNEILDMLRGVVEKQQQFHERTRQVHKQKMRELLEDSKPSKAVKADSLAPPERAIADKYKHVEEAMLRMAELSAGSDPRRAALLKKAVGQAAEQGIATRFERIVELLGKQKLSESLENQAMLDRDLNALLELLMTENRAKALENEKARLREYIKQLGAILKREKDIQGRTTGGDDMKRLADEQAKVADKTGGLAKEIEKNEAKKKADQAPGGSPTPDEQKDEQKKDSKNEPKKSGEGQGKAEGKSGGKESDEAPAEEANPAQKQLESARKRMEEAEKNLKDAKRQGAAEKQEEAIRELEKAKAALEEILRQRREEEVERILTMLEARFRKMLQMQQEVYEGTQRLDRVPPADRTHNHEIEAGRLSGKQSQIVVEADKAALLLREDGSAVAIPEAIDEMREDMLQVVERLAQAKVDRVTQGVEEDILAALREMIDAIKKAIKDRDKKSPPPGKQGEGQQQDSPLVDGLSELKMIRALQMRVNARTARYAKMIEGEQADSSELIEALRRLAERQERIHRVTRDLQLGRNQ